MNVFFSAVIFVSLHQKSLNWIDGQASGERRKKTFTSNYTNFVTWVSDSGLFAVFWAASARVNAIFTKGWSLTASTNIETKRFSTLERLCSKSSPTVKWKNRKRWKSGLWFRARWCHVEQCISKMSDLSWRTGIFSSSRSAINHDRTAAHPRQSFPQRLFRFRQ